MRKEKIKDLAGISLFYLLIIVGVILINARFEYIDKNKINNTHISLN